MKISHSNCVLELCVNEAYNKKDKSHPHPIDINAIDSMGQFYWKINFGSVCLKSCEESSKFPI